MHAALPYECTHCMRNSPWKFFILSTTHLCIITCNEYTQIVHMPRHYGLCELNFGAVSQSFTLTMQPHRKHFYQITTKYLYQSITFVLMSDLFVPILMPPVRSTITRSTVAVCANTVSTCMHWRELFQKVVCTDETKDQSRDSYGVDMHVYYRF